MQALVWWLRHVQGRDKPCRRPVTLHYVPSDAGAVLELSLMSVAPLWGWVVEPRLPR